MPLRPPAGFISAFYDPLKVADAPTIGAASPGDAQATVTFTAPSNVGGSAITQYYAVSDPSQITGNAASSPVTVTGLTNGTAYTFRVWALNSFGPSPYSAVTGSVTPAAARGLFGGGATTGNINVISYISIATTGDAIDFGDLTVSRSRLSACASYTRAVFGGGSSSNVIDYVSFGTLGNATDFGDLLNQTQGAASFSNETRGIWAGGLITINVIQYITIATVGNATDFGDISNGARYLLAGCSSTTRGVFGGGGDSSGVDTLNLQYVTIATTGNSTNFGNLTGSGRTALASASSNTRGLFAGGVSGNNIIDYVTIATTGNATDFGDLTQGRQALAGCSSSVRATFGGGIYISRRNIIDYVTIATTGNATDFGDLLSATEELAACSNANGGLS